MCSSDVGRHAFIIASGHTGLSALLFRRRC